ncbi:substrate-binding domain-containing protein [Clostridium sp.]|uniref:substrate-binding domain-containing protein n=1 Tax=Clostridium sp. TaxID=1506 RepID=UPI001A3B9ADA|nr:substrate-binding domain-containing protein [Clostridium sp.]MBK5236244.1 substrate-binding domain-containing protein [Clostridium sp.]
MKKALAILMIATLGFTGCSQTAKTETPSATEVAAPDQLVIGMSFQEMENPYFITMNEAVQEAADAVGAKLIVTDAKHDVIKQTSDIEDMIQKGVKILLLNPTDSKGIETAVIEAKKAGLTVVCIDAQANGPIDSFVGSKNYDAGYLAGKQMGKDLGGKGKVAILNGIPVVPILERVKGFEAAMKEFPDIKVVDNQNGQQDRAKAMTVTENMMQTTPDLKAIFSVNDTGSLGSVAAIESASKDVGVYSVDGAPEAVKALLEGDILKCTVAQYPRDQVRIGFGIALAKYLGANVPDSVPVDVKALTKENAEGFAW